MKFRRTAFRQEESSFSSEMGRKERACGLQLDGCLTVWLLERLFLEKRVRFFTTSSSFTASFF